jgi:hypothetical protein
MKKEIKEITVVVIIFSISIGLFDHDLGIKEEPHIHPEPYLVQNYKVLSSISAGSGELTSDSTQDFTWHIK